MSTIPEGWKLERIGEREIRIVDPDALGPFVIRIDDQALIMRTLWRLAVALLDAATAPAAGPSTT